MSSGPDSSGKRSNAYELFILVLTLLSLGIMVVLVLPVSDATRQLLTVYDNAICVVFLIDFFGNLSRAPTKREYFIGRRGWLDLSRRRGEPSACRSTDARRVRHRPCVDAPDSGD